MILKGRAAARCLVLLSALESCRSAPPGVPPGAQSRQAVGVFVGYISESDCGPDHAPMLATGRMGTTDRDCALKCVRGGAVFGFVDASRQIFFQLDDQDKPGAFAGRRVRITGRLEGDTLFVSTIEAAD